MTGKRCTPFITAVLVWYLLIWMGTVVLVFADIVEMQIPGTYSLVSLGVQSGDGALTTCAPSLKVSLLEVKGTAAKQLFVVPHSAFSVPAYSVDRNPGFQPCTPLTMEANTITRNSSATVLRRSRDLAGRIDMRVSLLKNLELLRESYFVGYEHGDRICNGYAKAGDKYIFYFGAVPCFYKADAKVVGDVNIIRSPSPLPGQGTIIPPNGNTNNDAAIKGDANAVQQPAPTEQPRRGPACFPGNARVTVRRKHEATKAMEMDISQVETGDMVSDGIAGEKWTRVIAQTHSEPHVHSTMVQIDARYTGDGLGNGTERIRRLTLSGDHLVPRWDMFSASLALVPARKLRLGDMLADEMVITAVNRSVVAKGLYAPVTESGTMAVDGVYVSCYAVDWKLAHALLAPLRIPAEWTPFDWETALMGRLRLLRDTTVT